MYKDSWLFNKPKNEDAKIWRYMDFTKFLSLLDKSALFFPRADKLNDPFEGSCPEKVMKSWAKKNGFKYVPQFYQYLRKFTFINSWHLNQDESPALWKLYLKSNEGIAIQSNFTRLKNSFKDKKHDIFIGKVQYIDHTKYNKYSSSAITYPILYKRKIFKHEDELRAVISNVPKEDRSWKPRNKDGIYVPVDLNILISSIYLAPTSPRWLFELVNSVTEKYGLKKEVLQSTLDEVPVIKM